MSGVNKVILIGNVGKDPEVRHLEGGATVANFSLATSESYKDKNGNKVDTTEWHNIVLWRGLADVAERFVRKGSKVYIEGKIKTRQYKDKDGNVKYMTEIMGDTMTMLDSKRDATSVSPVMTNEAPAPSFSSKAQVSDNGNAATDDLPF